MGGCTAVGSGLRAGANRRWARVVQPGTQVGEAAAGVATPRRLRTRCRGGAALSRSGTGPKPRASARADLAGTPAPLRVIGSRRSGKRAVGKRRRRRRPSGPAARTPAGRRGRRGHRVRGGRAPPHPVRAAHGAESRPPSDPATYTGNRSGSRGLARQPGGPRPAATPSRARSRATAGTCSKAGWSLTPTPTERAWQRACSRPAATSSGRGSQR
jgi:hypothetical protein